MIGRVTILYRRSKFYPDPVVCGVFSGPDQLRQISGWIEDFLVRFPEFGSATFDQVGADLY